MHLIDTHVHLPLLNDSPSSVIDTCARKSIDVLINVGYDLDSSVASFALSQQFLQVYASVGLHPHYISEKQLQQLIDWVERDEVLKHPKVVGWGEIGLDYVRSQTDRSVQRSLFDYQLHYAWSRNIPVVIHHRDAEKDMLDVLSNYKKVKGVMHCYSSLNPSFAEKVLSIGLMISFAGNITFPSCALLREVASTIPLDSLLLETDAPYLSPSPYRGRQNHPEYVAVLYTLLAESRKLSIECLSEHIMFNAKKLFGF